MSFSAEWLALRAGADARARDPGLRRAAARWARAKGAARIVDLGAGSGATLAALAREAGAARWRLVDTDPVLLERAAERAAELGAQVETRVLDLSDALDEALAAPVDLVTASAFFDLASAAWIDRFAAAAARTGAAVYAALSYDGVERWTPAHGEDATVLATFHADMRRDKGLGPALGPDAAAYLVKALGREGFAVVSAPSPWILTPPRDRALIAALSDGTADATGASDAWRAARLSATRVEIGHLDIWATPPNRLTRG